MKTKRTFGILQIILIMIFTVVSLFAAGSKIDPEILKLKAPEKFKIKFETTKGDFEITAERKFSPLAVDRLFQLLKSNYFTDIPVYRGVANFVVQFGTLDSIIDNDWSQNIILDEPVLKGNDAGTIAFARAGKNSRGAQLFINLQNNSRLDTISYGETLGFPAFGFVSSGMDVVNNLYTGYNDEPRKKLDSTITDIPGFLKKNFPNLDYIKKAYIMND